MTHLRAMVAASLACVGAAAVAGSAPPAGAAVGAAVAYGFFDVPKPLAPGDSIRLPTWGVRNPGDETTGYSMFYSPLATPGFRQASAAWFRFDPTTVRLRPGTRSNVNVRLRVPRAAKPGRYEGLMKAQIISEGGTGAQVGGAAAARLRFRVAALPSMRLIAQPSVIRAGHRVRVAFRIAAAPRCRARVLVVFAGRGVRTNAAGRASLLVRMTRTGSVRVRATKRGCGPATTTIRVLRAPR